MDSNVHGYENNPKSTKHLEANLEHFESQASTLYRLMCEGERFTARKAVLMGFSDRRLRDLYASKEDVRREWVQNGKIRQVEYFIK